MSQSGTELYMLHMRHIRNDKFQDSFIELHPDRALNNLNGVVRKNALNKFVLTTSGYKYCINHVDNNQYVLMEIIKGIRYYGWRLLSSHAHTYNNNSMDMIVETNFFFEIDAMDFILQNSTSTESGGESRYAMYESKKTDQLLADVEAMRRAEQQALSIDFDYEEVSGTNPAKNKKIPHVAEYGQVLLDSSKAVAQSGPYGFARQHGHSPKSRKDEVNRRASEPDRIMSPPIAVAPAALSTPPQASGIPVRKSSGVTFSEAPAVVHDIRHDDPSPHNEPPAAAPSPVEVRPASSNGLHKQPEPVVHKAPSAVNAGHAGIAASAAAPVIPATVSTTATSAAPATSVGHTVRASPVTTTSSEPTRRPSLTSGLTAEEKQSAADKLFQKYGMKKASFTGPNQRGSFTSPSTDSVTAPSHVASANSSSSSLVPPKPSDGAATSAQPKTAAEVTNAANRLFEKYNRSPNPADSNGSSALHIDTTASVSTPSVAPAAAVPVVGAPLPVTSPHFSMASLFGQPEAEVLTVVKSELVHHPTVVKTADGTEVRSIGGFRRVKSVIIAEDHDDYGDLSKLKDINDESSVSTLNSVSTSSSVQPPAYVEPKISKPIEAAPTPSTAPAVAAVPRVDSHASVKAMSKPPSVAAVTSLPSETAVHAHDNTTRPPLGPNGNSVTHRPSLQRVNTDMNVDPVSSGQLKTPSEDDYGDVSQLKGLSRDSHDEVHLANVHKSAKLSAVSTPAAVAVAAPAPAPVVAQAPTVPAPIVTPVTATPAPVLPAISSFKAPTLIAAPAPYLTPSVTSATPDLPRPSSARNSVTFASSVDVAPVATPLSTSAAAPSASVAVSAAPLDDEDHDGENEDGRLRRPSSMFLSANPFDMLRKPVVDNSTAEEKMATQNHESSRTNHYSKLGSAFVSENVLSAGRGGRGGGRGRGIR